MPQHQGGKKGRKIGRNKAKPCQKRYVGERRSERNAARRAQRHAAWLAKRATYKANRLVWDKAYRAACAKRRRKAELRKLA